MNRSDKISMHRDAPVNRYTPTYRPLPSNCIATVLVPMQDKTTIDPSEKVQLNVEEKEHKMEYLTGPSAEETNI